MFPDEYHEEKPKRIYFLAFLTFFIGVGWIIAPAAGLWRFAFVVLGLAFMVCAWGLLECNRDLFEFAPKVYMVATVFDFLHGVGWLTTDPLVRSASLLSIFINMGIAFAFTRRSVSRWYLPRIRRGYYIGSDNQDDK